ncbi:hypothetical protein [Roseivirga pacifica]|uniref:hypothetical protein n=1 Tax=Roseivirga pacifica TaxID=1267423 RepID=UPI00227D6A7A|nr:hypothetical protein [Roseivirga pacifica]
MNKTYTYIFEFRGGTYVSQVLATGLNESVNEWLKAISAQSSEIYQLGAATIKEIERYLEQPKNREPVLLNNLENVWFIDIHTKQGLGLVHIIQTVSA